MRRDPLCICVCYFPQKKIYIIIIGSIFELAGGHPQFGFAVTCASAAVGVPLCFFLFYAAIKKGTAETEEDDKRFLGGK